MISRSLTNPVQNNLLNITLDKAAFYIDEYIQGKVELNTGVAIIVNDINLSFTLFENWIYKEKDSNIQDTHQECLLSMNLDIKRKLNINTNLVSLNPGKFIFPFYFKIPKSVQPCFEYPTSESKAYIRYALSAQIISPYANGGTSTYVILKSRPIMPNKQLFFTATSSLHKWGLISSGSTTLNISILNGTDCFKNGSKIDFNIDIDNSKGKLSTDECKINLMRKIVLKSKYGKQVKEIKNECISKKFKTVVNVNEKKNFNVSLSLREMDNSIFNFKEEKIPYINISDMGFFLPSINSFLIECKYTLKATLYFSSFVKFDERPRIIIPISVCHQSLEEFNQEVQNYYQSQNQYKNQVNNQYNNQYNSQINNQANNQYNNQYNNQNYNQYYNNQNPEMTINRSGSLNNNSTPLSLDENKINDEVENELHSQEEIEKPHQNYNNDNNNTNGDLGAPSFDAPAPVFYNKP